MFTTPPENSLAGIIEEMRGWDFDPDAASLHVGDLGWNQQFGATVLAAALRVWRIDGDLAAVGLLEVPAHHLRIEDVDPGRLQDRLAVHHSPFNPSTFTSQRWLAMTQGPA